MLKFSKKIKESLQYINPISKFILKAAAILTIVLYTGAACIFILAGRGIEYHSAMLWGKDMLECIKPSLAILLVGAVIFESIYTPKSDGGE